MPIVGHEWSSGTTFQAPGTIDWEWDRAGEGDHYWAYSVRPRQANILVEVLRQWTTVDNNLNPVEHFRVRVADFDHGSNGGLLMFNVIKVEGS